MPRALYQLRQQILPCKGDWGYTMHQLPHALSVFLRHARNSREWIYRCSLNTQAFPKTETIAGKEKSVSMKNGWSREPRELTTASGSAIMTPNRKICFKTMPSQGQHDGAVDKGASCQAYPFEFNPWDCHSGRKDLTLKNSSLTSIYSLWYTLTQ